MYEEQSSIVLRHSSRIQTGRLVATLNKDIAWKSNAQHEKFPVDPQISKKSA